MNNIKIGDHVELLNYGGGIDPSDDDYYDENGIRTWWGHYIGDIGVVMECKDNQVLVLVENRISTSLYKPYVTWNKRMYRKITRTMKIDKLLS